MNERNKSVAFRFVALAIFVLGGSYAFVPLYQVSGGQQREMFPNHVLLRPSGRRFVKPLDMAALYNEASELKRC